MVWWPVGDAPLSATSFALLDYPPTCPGLPVGHYYYSSGDIYRIVYMTLYVSSSVLFLPSIRRYKVAAE